MRRFGGSASTGTHSVELRGIHIPHEKLTAEMETVKMPLPTRVVLPMQQHVGTPCVPQVKRKQHVEVGQLIGHADARLTCDIFSPVSGVVTEIRQMHYSNGWSDEAVVIEPDGEQTVHPSVQPPEITDFASLVEALKHSGIVGLGGAGFPAWAKMNTDLSNIDTWLVNAAECEPYLSTDYREMIEHPDTLLEGIKTCLDLSGVPRSLICIEDNKPKAIELLRQMTADDPRIDVYALPARYPQGASRVILRNVTGRSVPRGGHLTDVGALLYNVTTMSEIGRYLRTGMPLVKRRLTVMGDAIAHPQNLEVYVGTPVSEILEYCGCAPGPRKVIIGGPMMGTTQVELDVPIVRQNCGLLAFGVNGPVVPRQTACIKCSRCIDHCPIKLSPIDIHKAYIARDVAALDRLMADLCVECGTCSYVCPSKQPLVQSTHLARAYLRAEQRRAKGRR